MKSIQTDTSRVKENYDFEKKKTKKKRSINPRILTSAVSLFNYCAGYFHGTILD